MYRLIRTLRQAICTIPYIFGGSYHCGDSQRRERLPGVDTGGRKGFVENDWVGKTIAIGLEVRIQVTGPCPRCVMTTLPQADLPKDPSVLKTAAQHNEARVGAYASIVQTGTIRIGDKLSVI